MIYLFNKSMQLQGVVQAKSVVSAHQIEELNKPKKFDCVVLPSVSLNNALYIAHKDTVNENRFHIYKIIDTTWNGNNVAISGIDLAYYELSGYGYIKDYRPQNKSVLEVAQNILNGSLWQVYVPDTFKNITDNFYYVSRMEAIHKVLEKAKAELNTYVTILGNQISSRSIDIVKQRGENRGRRYVHGSNLLEVIKEQKSDSIYTALIGRGKGEQSVNAAGETTGGYGRRISFENVIWRKSNGDPVDKPIGQEWVEIQEATSSFGYADNSPRIGIVEFSEIEDPVELLNATYQALVQKCRPQIAYRTRVIDDSETELGDTVAVIRNDLNIRYLTRIYKRDVNLLDPKQVRIELGDQVQNYTTQVINALSERITESSKDSYLSNVAIVNHFKNLINEQYWGEDGYNYDLKIGNEYGLPAGLYSYDKPIDQNPTKVIYIGAGKMLIANTKNSDGTWKWSTMATGDGLAANTVGANQLISGSVTTDHVAAGGINANKIILGEGQTLNQILDELSGEISTLQAGGGNLLINSNFGTGAEPSDAWWTESLTFGESRKRGLTFSAMRSGNIKFADTRSGEV